SLWRVSCCVSAQRWCTLSKLYAGLEIFNEQSSYLAAFPASHYQFGSCTPLYGPVCKRPGSRDNYRQRCSDITQHADAQNVGWSISTLRVRQYDKETRNNPNWFSGAHYFNRRGWRPHRK